MGVRAIAGAVFLALTLTGCASTVTTVICADYGGFASVAEAGEASGLVVVGRVLGDAGERTIDGEQAPVHLFEVEAVVTGELSESRIEVAAAPLSCNGPSGPFPDGDPLETDDRVELFLIVNDAGYRLIDPWDGVAAAPEGEPLPWTG